ncbi:6577_t:CDS:2, partial [Ambispora leptoticha]
MIVDNSSDQSVDDNRERAVYMNENMTTRIDERENMNTAENTVSIEVD